MLCQIYVLQPSSFYENNGKHENDKDSSVNHKQELNAGIQSFAESRTQQKWRKPRECRVQTTGSPKTSLETPIYIYIYIYSYGHIFVCGLFCSFLFQIV